MTCSRIGRAGAWIVAPAVVLALTTGLGAGGAGAAPRPAAGVTWTKLTLLNSWSAASGNGNPAYAKKGGIVYLSGGLTQNTSSSTNAQFATLPKAAWPGRWLYLTVPTWGSDGTLAVSPAGALLSYSNTAPPSPSEKFTSLAAVSFPVSSFTTHKLKLRNGWASADKTDHTGDPAYAVSGGITYLSGSLLQASGSRTLFAVLPTAARPAHLLQMIVYTNNGSTGELRVYPNGNLRAIGAQARNYTSLAGVSYPVPGPVIRLKLINHWVPAPGSGNPGYVLKGGVVYLSGGLTSPNALNTFTSLPSAIRPAHDLFIKVYEATGTVGELALYPSGEADLLGPGNAPFSFSSLAGVSYPLGS